MVDVEDEIMRVCADGSGAVKDECWTLTEGPEKSVTSYGGWHLRTSTGATVQGHDRMDYVVDVVED